MIDPTQFRRFIVRPALEVIGLWSQDAENLVMGTAAQESRLKYIKQLGGGPALGLFQMEPRTHDDIWKNYLAFKPEWEDQVMRMTTFGVYDGYPDAGEMVWNLRYAAAMCRLHYRRQKGVIPSTVAGQAAYWKRHFNTHLGKGTEQEFINNYALVA